MTELGMCEKMIYRGRWHDASACGRKAKVERYGHKYCGVHDPNSPAREKKKADHKARWEAKENAWREARKRNDLLRQLSDHIPTNDLILYELVRKAKP